MRKIKKTKSFTLTAILIIAFFIFAGAGCEKPPEKEEIKRVETPSFEKTKPEEKIEEKKEEVEPKKETYEVIKVVDGDTIDVEINGVEERIRIIGINSPESVDPGKPVECFANEASNKAKELLENKSVTLEADNTQTNKDKYNRLLRHIFLEDGTNFAETIIRDGHAYEYTYDLPYKYQSEYKRAEKEARENKRGLWADDTCRGSLEIPIVTTEETKEEEVIEPKIEEETKECLIKENISYKTGEKIYHVPGGRYYDQTVISPLRGERWFCTEQEAINAGWRKSKY
jgi:micrococcal nuclease